MKAEKSFLAKNLNLWTESFKHKHSTSDQTTNKILINGKFHTYFRNLRVLVLHLRYYILGDIRSVTTTRNNFWK